MEKAGFKIVRGGEHIVMSNGMRFVTVPRDNPAHAIAMGGMMRDAGLNVDEFKKLL